ncbi:hypothetical protein ACFOGJ_01085 [Marinibaculum pumilum]|uniref:Flagellar basal body-associated protein FliL n=1 Tax=Marinibaculum pumilum TaxID=1766165 RepID=A0ABV7KU40_9PROT
MPQESTHRRAGILSRRAWGLLPAALVTAVAILAWNPSGPAHAAGGNGGEKAEEAAPQAGDTLPLEPFYAPMVPPDRGGRPQAAITMALVIGPDGSPTKLRALMPRFRDAVIRDFFAYPITQTGEFPADMLPSVTKRVMSIANKVYGKDVVSGVMFTQILKIGC